MIKKIEEFNERRKTEGMSTIAVSLEAEKFKWIPVDFLNTSDYVSYSSHSLYHGHTLA